MSLMHKVRQSYVSISILLARMAGLQAFGKRMVGYAVEGGVWCAVGVRVELQTRLAEQ